MSDIIHLTCSSCGVGLKAKAHAGGRVLPCPNCRDWVWVPEPSEPRRDNLGSRPSPSSHRAPVRAARTEQRPWTPLQIFAVSWLFGPLACGVISGINFARMGKRDALIPSILGGVALFLLEAWVLLGLVPEAAARPVSLLANLGIGLVFLLAHKPVFDEWKSANWAPAQPGEMYKASRLGQLFLVSLLCACLQLGGIVLFLALGGNG